MEEYNEGLEEYNEVMSNIREKRKRKTDWSSSCASGHEPTVPKEELLMKLLHAT